MTDRMKLFKTLMPSEFVLFDHNPKSFIITRGVKGGGRTHGNAESGALDALFYGTNPAELKVTDAYIKGPETKLMCDHILGWLNPDNSPVAKAAQALGLLSSKPPLIVCQWGPPAAGFMMTCTMKRASINYVRVDSSGIPTLAKVGFSMQESPLFMALTNPTSGGRPGRNRHVVTSDESLMSIATATFGSPGAWRAIAEVNGIDDPNSIRPGDVIHLPAREELREMAEAAR